MNSSSQEDVIAVEDDYTWFTDSLLRPIFSSDGDYPRIMKERIANYSDIQGFTRSRLPSFTKEQIRDVRGSADFLAIDYYTYEQLQGQDANEITTYVSYAYDVGAKAANEINEQVQIYSCLIFGLFITL